MAIKAGINQKHEIVILVHGFNNDESDMFPLKRHLEGLGYEAVTINLPLRFSALEECISLFEYQFQQIDYECIEKIHFVGYSMGGLIVRSFLANNTVSKLGRCVLIATPNKGTKLADLCDKLLKPVVHIYQPLKSLKTSSIDIGKPINNPQPDIGVIAGNSNKHILGIFLDGENDGRVEVESVKYDEMIDFIIRPYGHKEIHHQTEIADLIDLFLRTGKFST